MPLTAALILTDVSRHHVFLRDVRLTPWQDLEKWQETISCACESCWYFLWSKVSPGDRQRGAVTPADIYQGRVNEGAHATGGKQTQDSDGVA